jgi:RNA polymerase sigma-70 factor (ECF subfamily)
MDAAELMRGYCEDREGAFEALYGHVAPRLRSYLRTLLRDAAAADDLMQQTFLKLHQARRTYIDRADPVPWIFAIAHRSCIDEIRRRRRAHVRLTKGTETLPELEAGIDGTASGAEADEPYAPADRQRVLDALADLPEDQRMAVVLTKLGGKSVAEAAAIEGTTPGALKLRAHRAYGKLRARLGASTDDDSPAGTPVLLAQVA